MSTITPPITHAQTESIDGYSYVIAAEGISEEITERLDVLQMGIIAGRGDLQGSGSDTLRDVQFGGVGFAEQFTAMVGENDPITPTGHTETNNSYTLGRYGLAKEESYQHQILARPGGSVGLGLLVTLVPASYLATLRANACTVGATFASGAGTSGSAWNYDEELELIALFHETEGFDPLVHRVITIRHPEQYTDMRLAARTEPGLQNDAALQQALMGLGGNQGDPQGAFQFLGMRNFSSHDVATSGGDWVGCAYVAGAIAWVTANTSPVRVGNRGTAIYIPQFGIVIEEGSNGNIASGSFDANGWFGMAKRPATLFPQFKITSVND